MIIVILSILDLINYFTEYFLERQLFADCIKKGMMLKAFQLCENQIIVTKFWQQHGKKERKKEWINQRKVKALWRANLSENTPLAQSSMHFTFLFLDCLELALTRSTYRKGVDPRIACCTKRSSWHREGHGLNSPKLNAQAPEARAPTIESRNIYKF